MPPWKGDFHNDLNTQLSYWPAYTGNHLKEAATYTEWLWKTKPNNQKFTKQYFGVGCLNVPGVETINGKPMVDGFNILYRQQLLRGVRNIFTGNGNILWMMHF
jgi:hypothetical protein